MTLVVAQGLRLRSGRYELERRLGSGAAATVWLARDTLLERPVAVKVLAEGLTEDRAWLARFKREARVAARLQHPNLVSIYDFEAEAERPYLVMAYLSGGSLEDRLGSGGAPDPERLSGDVLRALAHIHEADIVHRDVKPGNVLLARDGRACVTDFGVARPQDATSITQTGQIPGTARYMAPELWQGEPADERSDLFACGVLLAQCLRDDSPARLVSLVERLSAEQRELRPGSAAEALRVLEPEHPTPSKPLVLPPTTETAVTSFSRPPRRWLAVAALCAAALIAGILFADAIGGGDDPTAPQSSAEREAGSGSGDEGATADQSPPPPAGEETPPAEPVVDGAALNDEGFALIQQGRYDEAVPVLQQAVDVLDGEDITYAYALFNLGNALRLAGRPAEAIPILEQRLQIPNQTDAVQDELKQAKKDLKAQEKG
jgi:serine/threonine-protein kinase